MSSPLPLRPPAERLRKGLIPRGLPTIASPAPVHRTRRCSVNSVSLTLLQSLGIARIGSAHDPDRSRAPALHHLTEKESATAQPFESRGVHMASALLQNGIHAEV